MHLNGTIVSNIKKASTNVNAFVFGLFSDFFIFRYEDFGKDPKKTMDDLYRFLGYETFEHDFKNINFTPKEHDTAYWSYVDHTVGKEVKYLEPDYSVFGGLNEEILHENSEFYKFFYPELFEPSLKRTRF
jgi:hypothetical protein